MNVDQDVVEWGTKTAQTLRVMATSRREAGLSAGSQKSGLRSGAYYDSYYNSVSYTSGTAATLDKNQVDVQTANIATAKRVEGWQLIDNATAEVRKKQTQRYAQLAELDAQLAVSKSQSAAARKAADELLASIKTLRQEAERPAAPTEQRTTDDK